MDADVALLLTFGQCFYLGLDVDAMFFFKLDADVTPSSLYANVTLSFKFGDDVTLAVVNVTRSFTFGCRCNAFNSFIQVLMPA